MSKTSQPNEIAEPPTPADRLLLHKFQPNTTLPPCSRVGTFVKKMKNTVFAFLVVFFLATGIIQAERGTPLSSQPEISIFDSMDHIREFIAGRTKQDYSKMKLTRISLEYCAGPPKKGMAYVYFFNNTSSGLTSALCIYHFADGEIIETATGP